MRLWVLDVEVHTKDIAKYLVHGTHDVLWTNSIDEVLEYLKEDLENFDELKEEIWQLELKKKEKKWSYNI